MAKYPLWRRTVSTKVACLTLAGTRAKRVFAMAAMLLVAFACLALDQPQSPAPPDFPTSSPAAATPTPDAVTTPREPDSCWC